MQIQVLALLCLCAALVGCQNTDALRLEANRPLGKASRTGTTPLFTPNPTGATAQLTEKDKANIRTDLQASSGPASAQAAADNAGIYRRGVSELKTGGNTLTARRLERIQGAVGTGSGADLSTFGEDSAALTKQRLERIKAAGGTKSGSAKPEKPARDQ